MNDSPIIAYRSWAVSASCRQVKSTGDGRKAWPRLAAPAAACVHHADSYFSGMLDMYTAMGGAQNPAKAIPDDDEHHEAPNYGCKCGFYAMKRVRDIPNGGNVYGRVALWGRIIEHEGGYRSQYAYPQVFFVHPEADEKMHGTLRTLSQQYGCEVAPMPMELVVELKERAEEAGRARQAHVTMFSSYADIREALVLTIDPCADTPVDKREKGFAAKTMRHPFKSFMGGYIPPHARK